jgi:hypothetical protein
MFAVSGTPIDITTLRTESSQEELEVRDGSLFAVMSYMRRAEYVHFCMFLLWFDACNEPRTVILPGGAEFI